MSYAIRIDRFDAVDLPVSQSKLSYEQFRDAVLKAGRFSVFEATENMRMARLYTRLCRDPEVIPDHSLGFPWTKVSARLEGEEA